MNHNSSCRRLANALFRSSGEDKEMVHPSFAPVEMCNFNLFESHQKCVDKSQERIARSQERIASSQERIASSQKHIAESQARIAESQARIADSQSLGRTPAAGIGWALVSP
jgi:septal ring factor EnvC (AmiA/AmiB activator)